MIKHQINRELVPIAQPTPVLKLQEEIAFGGLNDQLEPIELPI
jgi:hypothetical protein